jgi:hypothetical protein
MDFTGSFKITRNNVFLLVLDFSSRFAICIFLHFSVSAEGHIWTKEGGMKREAGENYILRSLIICSFHCHQ